MKSINFSMKVILLAGIMFLLPAFLNSQTKEKDLNVSIEKADSGYGKWIPACWIGNIVSKGFDKEAVDPENKKVKVYKIVAGGNPNKPRSNRAVLWIQNPPFNLSPGYEYTFKGRIKTNDVAQKVRLIAAIRAGEVKDIFSSHLSGSNDWMELVAGPFLVNKECIPIYLSVDLIGPGTIWIGKLSFIERKIKPLRIEIPIKEYSEDDKVSVINISLVEKERANCSIEIKLKDKKSNIYENKKLIPHIQKFKESIDIGKLKAGEYYIEVNLIRDGEIISSASETITKTTEKFF